MEFRHLRYFLALAEELHFGRAAQKLSISQPPLSLNIRRFEESIGARLFDRNSKQVRLTAAGHALVPAARALLEQVAQAERQAREAQQGVVGLVRIGFVGSMLYRGLPKLLQDFQARHPQLRVLAREMNSADQLVELTHGQLDLAFVHATRVPQEVSREVFVAEPFVCCLPQGHPLAAARRVAVRKLEGEPLVMFSRDASPDYYERVLSLCTSAGFHPDVRHHARHWLSVVSMVAQGMGVALVPAALRRSGLPGAVFVPIDATDIRSETSVVWREADDNAARDAALEAIRQRRAAAAGR